MYMNYWADGSMAGINAWTNMPFGLGPLMGVAVLAGLWSLVWKGLALWHAGQRGHGWWFIVILLVNTLGILEIIYLFFVVKVKFHQLLSNRHHK